MLEMAWLTCCATGMHARLVCMGSTQALASISSEGREASPCGWPNMALIRPTLAASACCIMVSIQCSCPASQVTYLSCILNFGVHCDAFASAKVMQPGIQLDAPKFLAVPSKVTERASGSLLFDLGTSSQKKQQSDFRICRLPCRYERLEPQEGSLKCQQDAETRQGKTGTVTTDVPTVTRACMPAQQAVPAATYRSPAGQQSRATSQKKSLVCPRRFLALGKTACTQFGPLLANDL